jgi:hypothetical protein
MFSRMRKVQLPESLGLGHQFVFDLALEDLRHDSGRVQPERKYSRCRATRAE